MIGFDSGSKVHSAAEEQRPRIENMRKMQFTKADVNCLNRVTKLAHSYSFRLSTVAYNDTTEITKIIGSRT